MPRQARAFSESGYYHVINRGIGKQILFEDRDDFQRFLDTMKRYIEEEHFELICYCLMENHFHLLVHTEAGLDRIMKRICCSYAYYYNEKYGRTGHLFQERYRSEAIKDDKQLLATVRYIHNNPQKAGICRREEYAWSSWREYVERAAMVTPDLVLDVVGGKEAFLAFSESADEGQFLDDDRKERISDAQGQEIIRTVLKLKSGTQLQKMDKEERDAALRLLKEEGLSVRQIERLTGINRGVVLKA